MPYDWGKVALGFSLAVVVGFLIFIAFLVGYDSAWTEASRLVGCEPGWILDHYVYDNHRWSCNENHRK